MLVIYKEFYGTFICRRFEKKYFAYCIFTHLKPLLFQSVVLIKLRLQKGEVSELLHVGLIMFLQIFLNLLVFIHERWSKRLRKNNNLFVKVLFKDLFLVEERKLHTYLTLCRVWSLFRFLSNSCFFFSILPSRVASSETTLFSMSLVLSTLFFNTKT